MPNVTIEILEGRSPEKIRALGEEVTEAIVRSLGVPAAIVRVAVTELPPAHLFMGGQDFTEPARHTGAPQNGSVTEGV